MNDIVAIAIAAFSSSSSRGLLVVPHSLLASALLPLTPIGVSAGVFHIGGSVVAVSLQVLHLCEAQVVLDDTGEKGRRVAAVLIAQVDHLNGGKQSGQRLHEVIRPRGGVRKDVQLEDGQ